MLKEKKKRIKHQKRKLILVFVIIVLLIFLLLFLRFFLNNKVFSSFYSIEARLSQVKNVKIEKNEDFEAIGWIRVQGTNIDYPIIFMNDIHDSFPVDLESYVWSNNYEKGFHNYINITGHNVFNLSSTPKLSGKNFSRVEELMDFVYYDFAVENKYIQLTMDGKELLYKIYSVGFLDASEVSNGPYHDDYTKEEVKDKIKFFKDKSIYDYDIDVGEDDSLIYFSTCTRFFGNEDKTVFYIAGRLQREDEEIVNYNVLKNKNYKVVETKLKGDGKNEEENV